jgi:hypothetical protein
MNIGYDAHPVESREAIDGPAPGGSPVQCDAHHACAMMAMR